MNEIDHEKALEAALSIRDGKLADKFPDSVALRYEVDEYMRASARVARAYIDRMEAVTAENGTGALQGMPYCPCGTRAMWDSGHRFNFCPNCGKPIKWKSE